MMRPLLRRRISWRCALACVVALGVACAKSEDRTGRALPGDSVAQDGAITLSPPRLNTTPQEVTKEGSKKEPLGAIESRLFAPELIMENQAALEISPEQKSAILKEVAERQAEILKVQWLLQGEKEQLVKVLDADRIDEAKSKEVATRVMESESRVKSLHLTMLVRVKNVLSKAQQDKLRALRGDAPPRPSPAPATSGPAVAPASPSQTGSVRVGSPRAVPSGASRSILDPKEIY